MLRCGQANDEYRGVGKWGKKGVQAGGCKIQGRRRRIQRCRQVYLKESSQFCVESYNRVVSRV
jgi:hypothetical protein